MCDYRDHGRDANHDSNATHNLAVMLHICSRGSNAKIRLLESMASVKASKIVLRTNESSQ